MHMTSTLKTVLIASAVVLAFAKVPQLAAVTGK